MNSKYLLAVVLVLALTFVGGSFMQLAHGQEVTDTSSTDTTVTAPVDEPVVSAPSILDDGATDVSTPVTSPELSAEAASLSLIFSFIDPFYQS